MLYLSGTTLVWTPPLIMVRFTVVTSPSVLLGSACNLAFSCALICFRWFQRCVLLYSPVGQQFVDHILSLLPSSVLQEHRAMAWASRAGHLDWGWQALGWVSPHRDPEGITFSIEERDHFLRPGDAFVETEPNIHGLELRCVHEQLHPFQTSNLGRGSFVKRSS